MHCNDERTNLTGGQVVDRAQELRGKSSCSCEPDNHDFHVLVMITIVMCIQIIISRNSIHNTLYDDNAESRSSHCLETGAETRIAIHTQIYVVYLDFIFRFDSNSDERLREKLLPSEDFDFSSDGQIRYRRTRPTETEFGLPIAVSDV